MFNVRRTLMLEKSDVASCAGGVCLFKARHGPAVFGVGNLGYAVENDVYIYTYRLRKRPPRRRFGWHCHRRRVRCKRGPARPRAPRSSSLPKRKLFKWMPIHTAGKGQTRDFEIVGMWFLLCTPPPLPIHTHTHAHTLFFFSLYIDFFQAWAHRAVKVVLHTLLKKEQLELRFVRNYSIRLLR